MFSYEFISQSLDIKPIYLSQKEKLYQKIEINSKQIKDTDIFLGMKGAKTHGNCFAKDAYEKGVTCFLLEKEFYQKEDWNQNVTIFLIEDSIKALFLLAKSYRKKVSALFIGITGSNGKTSTRILLTTLLKISGKKIYSSKKNYNNHIGLPLSLLECPLDAQIVILEMGMNHKGEIHYLGQMVKPDISVITSIGRAHIEFFPNVEGIAKAKSEILDFLSSTGAAFFPKNCIYNDIFLKKIKATQKINYFTPDMFTVIENLKEKGYLLEYKGKRFLFPFLGNHQISNLSAASKVVEYLNLDLTKALDELKFLSPTKGRGKQKQIKEVLFIEDDYNGNPDSVLAGLSLLNEFKGNRLILVFADMLELGKDSLAYHLEIAKFIKDSSISAVFGYGNFTKTLLENCGKRNFYFEDKTKLPFALSQFLKKGDIVYFKAANGMKMFEIAQKTMEFFEKNTKID